MKPSIEAIEVADIFRRALRGEIAVKLLGTDAWLDVFCGDVEFMFDDWSIVIYNDVNELDYVDSAIAPDGRTVEYDDWFERGTCNGADPVDLLSSAERDSLESLIESLTPEGGTA